MTFAVNVQRKWDTQMCSLTLRMNFQTSSAVSLATHFRQEHRRTFGASDRAAGSKGNPACGDGIDRFEFGGAATTKNGSTSEPGETICGMGALGNADADTRADRKSAGNVDDARFQDTQPVETLSAETDR